MSFKPKEKRDGHDGIGFGGQGAGGGGGGARGAGRGGRGLIAATELKERDIFPVTRERQREREREREKAQEKDEARKIETGQDRRADQTQQRSGVQAFSAQPLVSVYVCPAHRPAAVCRVSTFDA